MANLQGQIDLLRLEKATLIRTKKGNLALVLPVDENDIYLSADETGNPKAAYLGVYINERREPSKFGATHYAKQAFSKTFREAHSDTIAERSKVYLGDFKPSLQQQTAAAPTNIAPAPEYEPQDNDDLPF